MPDFEAIATVRDFVELGGFVMPLIAGALAMMWTLILERVWYFRTAHRRARERAQALWLRRSDHSSWRAHQIRKLLISELRLDLERGVGLIKSLVALCPLFGLLGTVTGMIEVFDVMALSGSGNARGMASGVSKATLPTMAGMVAAISGMLFSVQIERYARDEAERVADSLEVVNE